MDESYHNVLVTFPVHVMSNCVYLAMLTHIFDSPVTLSYQPDGWQEHGPGQTGLYTFEGNYSNVESCLAKLTKHRIPYHAYVEPDGQVPGELTIYDGQSGIAVACGIEQIPTIHVHQGVPCAKQLEQVQAYEAMYQKTFAKAQ